MTRRSKQVLGKNKACHGRGDMVVLQALMRPEARGSVYRVAMSL